jgi:hypothetical protein
MEPTADKKAASKRYDVTLAGAHEHRGKPYNKGDVITLREDQVKRLEQLKLVQDKKPAREPA